MTSIAVCGAAGRMGKTILEVCHEDEEIEITAAIEHSESPALGSDAGVIAGIGNIDVRIIDDVTAAIN
jgi:4-hydroxy-tetrahydrodipicolinate reductase